jgi:peptidoglycan/xylan/chitin deacetylase (PgdA/CDA1 family)
MSIGTLHELLGDRKPVVGKRDYVVESMYEYGLRQGVPRLMKLFDKYGWKFTLWMVARAAETSGFYPKLLADKGHEVSRPSGSS